MFDKTVGVRPPGNVVASTSIVERAKREAAGDSGRAPAVNIADEAAVVAATAGDGTRKQTVAHHDMATLITIDAPHQGSGLVPTGSGVGGDDRTPNVLYCRRSVYNASYHRRLAAGSVVNRTVHMDVPDGSRLKHGKGSRLRRPCVVHGQRMSLSVERSLIGIGRTVFVLTVAQHGLAFA